MLQVDTITGDLTINRTTLRELNAFNSLKHVGGDLNIGGRSYTEGNHMMRSMSGFDALESIGGRLYLEFNTVLTSITAFERLTVWGGTYLYITTLPFRLCLRFLCLDI